MSKSSKPSTAAQKLIGAPFSQAGGIDRPSAFDDVWERKELSKRDRSLVTAAALIALNRPDELRFHLNYAVENEVRKEELIAVITHLAFYSSWPHAMTAIVVAKEAFAKSRNRNCSAPG